MKPAHISSQYHPDMVTAIKKLIDMRNDPNKLKAHVCNTLGRPRGICRYLNMEVFGVLTMEDTYCDQVIKRAAQEWEGFSGCLIFPINRPGEYRFFSCVTMEEMWLKGEYAQSRWDFVEFLLEYCQKDIK